MSACTSVEGRSLCPEVLFHLGYRLPDDSSVLISHFQGTRIVLLCGTRTRALALCRAVNPDFVEKDLCRTDRFSIYAPRCEVAVAAHGIGTGSIDTLLHELVRLLRIAGASEYIFLRLGSCGGLGVKPGTLVVTNRTVDADLVPTWRLRSVGCSFEMPAQIDPTLRNDILRLAMEHYGHNEVVMADTLCAESFYIAQERGDGAYSEGTQVERRKILQKLWEKGVRNFEMESIALAAIATRLRIPAAVCCVVLVDRLKQETPAEPVDVLEEHERRVIDIAARFVEEQLLKRTEISKRKIMKQDIRE